jgi:hypothetical protein
MILSFEIYHPKNNVHNQDGNHDDNKVRITIFFFELTDNDGQYFLTGIVRGNNLKDVILSTIVRSSHRFQHKFFKNNYH